MREPVPTDISGLDSIDVITEFPNFAMPANIQADHVPSGRYDHLRAYRGTSGECKLEFIPALGSDSSRISIPAVAMNRLMLSWFRYQVMVRVCPYRLRVWVDNIRHKDWRPAQTKTFAVTQPLAFARQYQLYSKVFPDSISEEKDPTLVEKINLHLGLPTLEGEFFFNVHKFSQQDSLSLQLDFFLKDSANYHAELLPLFLELGGQEFQTIEQICEVIEVYGFTPNSD